MSGGRNSVFAEQRRIALLHRWIDISIVDILYSECQIIVTLHVELGHGPPQRVVRLAAKVNRHDGAVTAEMPAVYSWGDRAKGNARSRFAGDIGKNAKQPKTGAASASDGSGDARK